MVMCDTMFSPSPDWNLQQLSPATGEKHPVASSGHKAPAAATRHLTVSPSKSTQSSPTSSLSKTVRRRGRISKASRKTPTTLLKANSTNFRALVQKFTGCPTHPFSSGAQKGPRNLIFKAQQDHCYSHNETDNYISSSSSSVVVPIPDKIYHHHNNNNHVQYSHEPPAMVEEQLHGHLHQQPQFMHSSLDRVGSEHVFLGGDKEDVQVVGDGLFMDNLTRSLHDQLLGVDACNFLMSENIVNDGYFW